jgi:hypothetical protein
MFHARFKTPFFIAMAETPSEGGDGNGDFGTSRQESLTFLRVSPPGKLGGLLSYQN